MAIDINHNVNFNVADFETVFNSFTEKLVTIVDNLNLGSHTSGPGQRAASETKASETDVFTNFIGPRLNQTLDKTFSKFKELDLSHLSNRQLYGQVQRGITKLSLVDDPKASELIKSLNENVRTYKEGVISSETLTERLKEIKSALPPPSELKDNFNANLAKTITAVGASGALLKIGSLIGARGGIEGSASQSLNTGILNSGGFVNEYQSKLLNNEQDIKNTGITLAAGLIAGGITALIPGAQAFVPYAATAAAGAAGTASSYFGGKSTQQQIASNQFLTSQDDAAFRLRNVLGFGSTGEFNGERLSVKLGDRHYNTQLSRQQAELFNNPKYAPFANYFPDYAFNANREQFNKESGNIGGNLRNAVTGGKLLGYGDNNIGQFIGLLTTTAFATGQSSNDLLNKILEANKHYGGDTAKNTALTLQLLQTSHLAGGDFDKAFDLVNRYQYNPAALQNVTNATNTSPSNKFLATQIGGLLGLSGDEISSGDLSHSQILRDYRAAQATPGGSADPKFLLLEMFANLRGQDLNVSESGIMKHITTQGRHPIESAVEQLPASMQAFGDTLLDSLKNLKIDNQQVHATNVYLQGGLGGTQYQESVRKPGTEHLYNNSGSGTTAQKKNK